MGACRRLAKTGTARPVPVLAHQARGRPRGSGGRRWLRVVDMGAVDASRRLDEYSAVRRPDAYVVTVPCTRRRPTLELCQALAQELALTQGLRDEPEISSYGERRATSDRKSGPRGWIFTWHC